jgi:predicted Holliday junction resolvase-like endonuclease
MSIFDAIRSDRYFLFFAVFCGAGAVSVFFLGLLTGRLTQRLGQSAMLRNARAQAVKQSRAVIGGQLGEQIAPFLPGFPCNPGDARFVGKPVDFIAFTGLSEGRVDEILLIEVKTGGSSLSAREREVKKAVTEGRVRYTEYRVPGNPSR